MTTAITQKILNLKHFYADYKRAVLCKSFVRYLYYNFGPQLQKIIPQNKADVMLP